MGCLPQRAITLSFNKPQYPASDTLRHPEVDLDIEVYLGAIEMRAFTLSDYLSLVPLLMLCSLGPDFSFQRGDHCLAGMVKQQVVLVCVVQLSQLPGTDFTGQGFPEIQHACGCETGGLGVSSKGTSHQRRDFDSSYSYCAFGCPTLKSAY